MKSKIFIFRNYATCATNIEDKINKFLNQDYFKLINITQSSTDKTTIITIIYKIIDWEDDHND